MWAVPCIDGHDDDAFAIDACVLPGQRGERAHEEAGGHHEHETQRKLERHQRVAQCTGAMTGRSSTLLQRLDWINPRRTKGRYRPEEQGSGDGNASREPEDTP